MKISQIPAHPIVPWIFASFLLGASPEVGAEEAAEFRFARIIGDHVVIQQEKPIKVWGWAKPNATVAVTITQDSATGEQGVAAAVESGTHEEIPVPDSDGYKSLSDTWRRIRPDLKPIQSKPQPTAEVAGSRRSNQPEPVFSPPGSSPPAAEPRSRLGTY